MKKVQAPPHCVEEMAFVILEPDELQIRMFMGEYSYRFQCPECGMMVERAPLTDALAHELIEIGVPMVSVTTGGPLSLDDLIDLHFELERM